MKKLRVEIQEKLEMNSFNAQHLEHKGRIYKVRTWNHNAFLITDLTNAGKRGTTCSELSVNANYDAPDCAIWNELLTDHLTELFEAATNKALPSELEKENFKFYFREVESKRLLAVDLSTIKPLTEEPNKWTLPHVVRALINGQYEGLRCKYRHLDDTCQDCGAGEIKDPVKFVKGIIEDPSGWWVNKDGHGIVTVCCHTFDSNEFRPVITPISKRTKKKETPQIQREITDETKKELPSFDAENLTIEEAKQVLKTEGVFIEETTTAPKKAGKKPRPVWQVSGRTSGLEEAFYNLGCSRRRWRGMFSFWEGDPTLEIAQAILEQGRLSFAEQQERKEERAINRAERYEQYADNAVRRSNQLYKTNKALLDCMAGTPILIGHHSEKRHRRDLEKIDNRTRKSIEEDKKAEHYQRRISHINWKVEKQKHNPTYLNNRIEENEARLRKIEKNKKWLSDYESRKQEVTDKLDYFKGLLNEVMQERVENGKVIPSPSTISKGDLVKYRGTWYPVVRVNQKTVTLKNWIWESGQWKAAYADITDIKKPTAKAVA
ncbi:MAG: hypothetical protein COW78_12130 [Bdellovibrio sp. CG22_combo_CG10-13_8_21_14_all_39_27]|nr:MAG: hypothetical protein COW78_12130 [Bdellovibrio sp. CG22_combo_CG10-13_8_21_14_all_39_27]